MSKLNRRKQILIGIIKDKPEAVLVKNKYKVLLGMLKRVHPSVFLATDSSAPITNERWESIIFDIVQGNRDWQQLSEGCDKENKVQLQEQWVVDNYMR